MQRSARLALLYRLSHPLLILESKWQAFAERDERLPIILEMMMLNTKMILIAAALLATPALAETAQTTSEGALSEPTEVPSSVDAAAKPTEYPTTGKKTVTQSPLATKIKYQSAFDQRLKALDEKVSNLKGQVDGSSASATVTSAMTDADARIVAAESSLKAFKDHKVEGWEAQRAGLEQVFAAADQAVESASQVVMAH